MNSNNTISGLEFAQIGWVVPDIHAAVNFLVNTLGVAGFPPPEYIRAQDLGMTYYGQVVAGDWLTTQTYNGSIFIELIQPLSGQSMFHDYLTVIPPVAHSTMPFGCQLAISTGSPAICANKVMRSSAKWTIQLHGWLFLTPMKR
jgi:hypothetical protein